jgi:hypothetical protein
MPQAETKEKQEIQASESLTDKELQDARQLINVFILAWRNYGLYPEDHITTIKSFENLVAAFDSFFTTHGNLRLTVEKDRLLCDSDLLYEVSLETTSEDITTLLYRDGIKWIEFQAGLTREEIGSLFRIAYKHRLLAEETEGDIVTDLIDEELDYIDFKEVDIFWQDLLLMDFSQLPPPAPLQEQAAGQHETVQSQQSVGSDGGDTSARSIADPSISNIQLELSETDYKVLQQMVQDEESWNITEDLFEALLIILHSQIDQKRFAAVLSFISEEIVETIELEKFELLVKLFQALNQLYTPGTSAEHNWRQALIDSFFQDLFKPEIFHHISEKLLRLPTSEIEKLESLGKALYYFSPDVLPSLVPVIKQRRSPEILQTVSEVMVHLSQRDIGPLEKIAGQHGAEIGGILLGILTRLQGDRVNKILFKLCDHSSDIVRRKAIKALLDRDNQYAQRLFSYIDDPSEEIRTSILAVFAKHKSSALENLLLNYLRGKAAKKKEPAHLLACYEALGRCGSNTSVPFLRRILHNRGWNSFMGEGKLIFRERAAIALALVDTPEANDVLQKASKSRFKVIRKAFDRAKALVYVSGEKTNE